MAASQVNDALWQQLRQLLPDGCTPADSLQADLGLDSLTGVELLLLVESHFNIRFPDDELSQIRTVLDLLQGVERHLSPLALLLIRLELN